MAEYSSSYYSQFYFPLQRGKYEQSWPMVKPLLVPPPTSLLDLGIGPAWYEDFLAEKGIEILRRVGVDVNEHALQQRKAGIEYVLTNSFATPEKFDFVVCWDSWHLFPEKDLFAFAKPGALVLVSEPQSFGEMLATIIQKHTPLVDDWVGDMEKSRLTIFRA